MNRACSIQHGPGYRKTQGEETKHAPEASVCSMCNLKRRMGVEESSDPNGCGFRFRTRGRASRVRGPGILHDLSLQSRRG